LARLKKPVERRSIQEVPAPPSGVATAAFSASDITLTITVGVFQSIRGGNALAISEVPAAAFVSKDARADSIIAGSLER
jgi:hypothetical protein